MTWWLLSKVASACTVAAPPTLAIDPSSTDSDAPEAAELESLEVVRGHAPAAGVGTSCDDLGTIRVTVVRPDVHTGDTGEVAATEVVGYQVSLLSGQLPDGMTLPTGALVGPEVSWTWIDGATNDQDVLNFTVALTATDQAGNLGQPLVVVIEDDGVTALSCDASGGVAAGLLVLATVAAVARRRS